MVGGKCEANTNGTPRAAATYQQVSGLILPEFPKLDGHTPAAGYQAVFWLCLGSVGLSIILVALSKEHRPAPSATT